MHILVIALMLLELCAYEMPLFQIYLGSTTLAIIKIIGFILLLYVTQHLFKKKSIKFPLSIAGYGLLILFMLPAFFLNGADYVVQFTKILVRLMYLPIFFYLISFYGSEKIRKILMAIGFVLSLQSIILYFFILLWQISPFDYLPRFEADDLMPSYGILGFGGWIVEASNEIVSFRVQSFYSEANKFAMFLLIPFFLYLGNSVRFKNLLCFSVVAISLILTFSLTVFISLIYTFLIVLIFCSFKKSPNIKIASAILIITITILGINYYSGGEIENTGIQSISYALHKNERSLSVRLDYAKAVYQLISENPWGLSEVSVEEDIGKLPMAPVRWFLWAGFLGGLFMLLLQLYLLFFIFISSIKFGCRIEVAIAACCIAFQFASINHGNWSNLDYFLAIAILLSLRNERMKNNSPIVFLPTSPAKPFLNPKLTLGIK